MLNIFQTDICNIRAKNEERENLTKKALKLLQGP